MRKATFSDKAKVIAIISRSFDENLSVNDVVLQDRHRTKRIKALASYSFESCMMGGEVWISEDQSATAMILLPGRKKSVLKSALLDLQLIFGALGVHRVIKVMNRDKRIKQQYTDDSYIYLWFIGVDPDQQKKGVGSQLLRELIDHYTPLGLPFYLETSMERNLPWYRSFGFEVYKEIEMGYVLYLMKKEIVK